MCPRSISCVTPDDREPSSRASRFTRVPRTACAQRTGVRSTRTCSLLQGVAACVGGCNDATSSLSYEKEMQAEEERSQQDKSIDWSERNGKQGVDQVGKGRLATKFRRCKSTGQNPFQCDIFAAEGNREARLVDFSGPSKGSQCKAPLAEYDLGGRPVQWFGFSGDART